MTKPVDAETHAAATKVLAEARRRGLDPIEALHHHGLLVTPAGDQEVRAQATQEIYVRYSRMRVNDFLRRKYPIGKLEQKAPLDLYNAILEWLEEVARGTS
jgi:hypothetical protein